MKETALVKSPEKYTWCVYESERDQVLRHRNGKTKHTLTKGKKFGHRLSRSKKYTRVIVPELGPTVVFTMTHKQLENLMNKSKVQKGRKPKMQRDRRQVVASKTGWSSYRSSKRLAFDTIKKANVQIENGTRFSVRPVFNYLGTRIKEFTIRIGGLSKPATYRVDASTMKYIKSNSKRLKFQKKQGTKAMSSLEMKIMETAGDHDMYKIEAPKTARGNPMDRQFYFKKNFMSSDYEILHTTQKEIRLLEVMLEANGKPVASDKLMKAAYPDGSEKNLSILGIFMPKINKKLKIAGAPGRIFKFVKTINSGAEKTRSGYGFAQTGRVPKREGVTVPGFEKTTAALRGSKPSTQPRLAGKERALYAYLKQIGKPVKDEVISKRIGCSVREVTVFAKRVNLELNQVGNSGKIVTVGDNHTFKFVKNYKEQ